MSLLDALIESDLITPPISVGGNPRREIWICRRTDGGSALLFGSGSSEDPYDGSTADKFDGVMGFILTGGNAILNPVIHIGPGVFETRGGATAGWFAKNAWICGSGMFVTTLKLIDVTTSEESRAVIATDILLTSFELTDITLDANLAGQPNTSGYDYARVATSGVYLPGKNILLRRVRTINWGTHTPFWEYNNHTPVSHECFPLSIGAPSIVEDCIVEMPDPNPARECSTINAGTAEDGVGQQIFEIAVVRNCYINAQVNGKSTASIKIKTIGVVSGTTQTIEVEFEEDHGKTTASWVSIFGVELDGSADNPYNGYFKVTSRVSSTKLRYDAQAAPVGTTLSLLGAAIGPTVQGITVGGVINGVVEGNRVIGTLSNLSAVRVGPSIKLLHAEATAASAIDFVANGVEKNL
jgi:hypothetical protein